MRDLSCLKRVGPGLIRSVTDAKGSIAVPAAVMMLVVLAVAGLGIDYSRAVRAYSILQAAADAAALAGVRSDIDINGRQQMAAKVFAANLNDLGFSSPVPAIDVQAHSASVTASAAMPTLVMGLLNVKTLTLKANAVAAAGSSPTDIYLVLDMSASMGIGATKADRDALKNLTAPWIRATGGSFASTHWNGCAFACHTMAGFERTGVTTYDAARAAGIQIREDVITDAASTFVSTVLDPSRSAVASNSLRVGVIGFSDTAQWLTEPTSDEAVATKALSTFPGNARNDTRFDVALPWVQQQSSSMSGTRKRTIVLVTDGVSGGYSKGFEWTPVESSLCNSIKASGAEIFVVEVRYENEAGDSFFDTYVKKFYSNIHPGLQACATSGQHVLSSTPDEIKQVFGDVANRIFRSSTVLTR